MRNKGLMHMQERRQSGVVTIISSETGVGKTKLLTVYHDLISASTVKKDRHQATLLGLLQKFASRHEALLTPKHTQAAAVSQWALALAGQQNEALQTEEAESIAETLKRLRESGPDAVSLHKLTCHMLRQLCSLDVVTSDGGRTLAALDELLNELQAFVMDSLRADKLVNQQQLAYVLQHALDGSWRTVIERTQAACKGYLVGTDSLGPLESSYVSGFLAGSTVSIAAQAVEEASSLSGAARRLLLLILGHLLVGSYPTFQAMQMHAQVTAAALHSKLRSFVQLAEQCSQECFTFFVDELNTSSVMGEMKSLFVDGIFEGRKLPNNIFLVAAINPARPESGSPRAQERQVFNSRYIVRPCPASIEEAVWAFGSMSSQQERDYVTAKLQMVAAEWTDVAAFDNDQSRVLMRYISTSQVRSQLFQSMPASAHRLTAYS